MSRLVLSGMEWKGGEDFALFFRLFRLFRASAGILAWHTVNICSGAATADYARGRNDVNPYTGHFRLASRDCRDFE